MGIEGIVGKLGAAWIFVIIALKKKINTLNSVFVKITKKTINSIWYGAHSNFIIF